jgi:voltage-gated potassium channel Kch
MNGLMTTHEVQESPDYFRIAWWRIAVASALAAGLCLGFPAGLLLWLILFRQIHHLAVIEKLTDTLQSHGLYSIYILVISSMLWSYLLGRISGYRAWWRIAVASALGILAAWFSPLANVDGILYEYRPDLPIHLNYAAAMAGLVGSVTLFVGLAYGLILQSVRAALTLGLTTSLVSVLILLLTIFVFDWLGIRVGTGNLAMPRVTVVGLLLSAITGGMALGVGFTWFVRKRGRGP